MPENPFGDFEDDFKNTEKAPQGAAPGRVPPATYKFVLVAQDVKGDDVLVDHEILVSNNTGAKGLKLFAEILDPASVKNPGNGEPQETKGKVIDHVFWVTKKNLPFVMRDAATIIGRDLKSMSELVQIAWAGKTFEGVVRDEEYQGLMRSRIAFINAWSPKKDDGKGATKDETKKADPKGGGGQKQAETAGKSGGAKKGAADF